MKVALVNPTPMDHYAPCIRALSSSLRVHGHDTRLILLPADTYGARFDRAHVAQHPESLVQDVLEKVADCDLVGVSFLSSMFDSAVQVTRAVQRRFPGKPIVWGGFHPTAMPLEALDFVDMVCVGEGEDALLELVSCLEDGKDPWHIRNFWFRRPDGRVVGNPLRPLIQDLDTLPFIDFDFHDDWSWNDRQTHLVRLDRARFRDVGPRYVDRSGALRLAYKTMATRGCPHRCAFCGVSFQHALYRGQRLSRRRSVPHLVAEIRSVVRSFPEIGIVHFQDDVFFSTSTGEISRFADAWKREIGLPFRAQCSPADIDEETLATAVDAGLVFTELGIQTGSPAIMKMYRRDMTNAQTTRAARLIARHARQTQVPDYHVILDNPWETTQDALETLHLLWSLPVPYNLLPSSLVPYPGTQLFRRAVEDGIVTDEIAQIYRKPFHTPQPSYLNFLFFLTFFNRFPKAILRRLASDRCVRLFHRRTLDAVWGKAYQWGEVLRQIQRLSAFAERGSLFEIPNVRELKRIANQMK
ncbi:MAG: B12-binding domain-containing radical SAM protein [Deltaproteobacteria bacterium]|nr:B12-binding domain-containing radical SAM protein [Deltaproteobacteria bacterium]